MMELAAVINRRHTQPYVTVSLPHMHLATSVNRHGMGRQMQTTSYHLHLSAVTTA